MTTRTGRKFHPWVEGRLEEIDILDIAAGLSKCCRFAGQCEGFYSVAQHCVLMSHLVPREHALVALLHDAPEAYLGDLVQPVKSLLPEYGQLEDRVWRRIAAKFNLPVELPPEVKQADLRMLQTERRDLLQCRHAGEWDIDELGVEPFENLAELLEPWAPPLAQHKFLERFRILWSAEAQRLRRG